MNNLKFVKGSDTEIEGLLIPFGGPFNGRDVDGEYFSAKTNFCLDWYTGDRPLLYHHGLDSDVQTAPVGRIKSIEMRDEGGWMKAQLDKASQYYTDVKALIEKSALGLSSGAMNHLVQKSAKTGELLRWPVVEGSLTPTPANIFATVDFATAKSHYKSAGLDAEELKAKMDAAERDALPDSDFAYIDAEGNRHLPINDAAHVRDALARFDQTEFQSEGDKQRAHEKIMAAAEKFGVQVSDSKKSATIKGFSGSYEDLMDRLYAVLNPASPYADPAYSYIVATYPDHVITCRCDDEGQTYWSVLYTLGDDGMPVLGKATQVEQDFVPTKAAHDYDGPLTLDAQNLTRHAGAFAARTKGVHDRRLEEGRVLSATNQQRISETADALKGVVEQLIGLVETSVRIQQEQARAEALAHPDALRLEVEMLSLFEQAIL